MRVDGGRGVLDDPLGGHHRPRAAGERPDPRPVPRDGERAARGALEEPDVAALDLARREDHADVGEHLGDVVPEAQPLHRARGLGRGDPLLGRRLVGPGTCREHVAEPAADEQQPPRGVVGAQAVEHVQRPPDVLDRHVPADQGEGPAGTLALRGRVAVELGQHGHHVHPLAGQQRQRLAGQRDDVLGDDDEVVDAAVVDGVRLDGEHLDPVQPDGEPGGVRHVQARPDRRLHRPVDDDEVGPGEQLGGGRPRRGSRARDRALPAGGPGEPLGDELLEAGHREPVGRCGEVEHPQLRSRRLDPPGQVGDEVVCSRRARAARAGRGRPGEPGAATAWAWSPAGRRCSPRGAPGRPPARGAAASRRRRCAACGAAAPGARR